MSRLRLAAGVVLLVPVLAGAHAFLLKSAPERRARLLQPPPRVELWFNERLEPLYSRLSVWSAAGLQVDLRDVAVVADDPRRLTVSLPPLGPGTYTVRYRVLSVDGHVVESSFPFTVKGRAPAAMRQLRIGGSGLERFSEPARPGPDAGEPLEHDCGEASWTGTFET